VYFDVQQTSGRRLPGCMLYVVLLVSALSNIHCAFMLYTPAICYTMPGLVGLVGGIY